MTVGEIIYKILGDDEGINKTLGTVGNAAKATGDVILKAAAGATAAAVGAITVLSAKAVQAYGDYEQLAGGVETLFKTSSDTVKQYADEAYKSAGMSANQYMETVTGFSASLLQSLNGDTAAAAEKANQAVIDMSDNANKMGTSLESIQNAYGGFAKGNFTMLDNLKLGYGGTKEEMQRLLEKAEELQRSKGLDVSYSIESFADIAEAIHVVQTDIGITGTTAKEAAETVQGSIGMMQGAWENFMVGLADPTQDFDTLTANLIDSINVVAQNLMPRIMAVLPQMATGVTQLTEGLLPLIPETLEKMLPDVLAGADALIQALLDTLAGIADTALPIVTDNASKIIDTLVGGLTGELPDLAGAGFDLATALITAILDNAAVITQGAVDLIAALAQGLADNLPLIIPAAIDAVLEIAGTLVDNIDTVINAAEQILTGLAEGLIEALPVLMEKAPAIIIKFTGELIEHIPEVLEFAWQLLTDIGDILANYDWSEVAQVTCQNIGDALESAQKSVQIAIDNIFNGGKVYGGDISKVNTTAFVENYRKGTKWMVDELDKDKADVQQAGDEYGDTLDKVTAEIAEKEQATSQNDGEQGDTLSVPTLKEQLAEKERLYAIHQLTEEQYWAARKEILEANRDDSDPEWWALYDKVTDHYMKYAETIRREADKAAKEADAAVKKALSDNVKKFELQQLTEGQDDGWLYDQLEKLLAGLDPDSDEYRDLMTRITKGRKTIADNLAKETAAAAKEAASALKSSYNAVVSERDRLAEAMNIGGDDLFREKETTDKSTGGKRKTREKIDLKSKIEAKKRLAAKVAELAKAGTPYDVLAGLVKNDPEEALRDAEELLKSPENIELLKQGEELDKKIADSIVIKSDKFAKMGEDAGAAFGDGFLDGIEIDWESVIGNALNDETLAAFTAKFTADNAVSSNAAGTMAANSAKADVGSTTQTAPFTAKQQGGGTYRIVDIDGHYIATVVNSENNRTKIREGG